MKLFILKRNDEAARDEMQTALVIAPNNACARLIAAGKSWGEGESPWIDRNKSTCKEVTLDGDPRLLIADVRVLG